ncbi:transcription factor PAP1 domain-containing protein [Trichoderma breve]|uniref:Transcription factor PAP1 domain-containing protein n=1 Tax=Trichoderma breve TaxID=2034170 RepID=A0A9W9JT90_9HYPO|nr:transcription factor PAP1 domain-containing protein [Trichoderma breve]KAJ4865427.1 transcription factor PAP1 domain-containing protein [Trichoderma breve]
MIRFNGMIWAAFVKITFFTCRRCSLNFRRIEEIQDIQINNDSTNAQAKGTSAQTKSPRPRKPPNPEDDISQYKQVQLVDVEFKIGPPTVDQLIMARALKLSSGDLSDTEYLAERLALVYGLCEADSLALSQKIDIQQARIHSLQRQLVHSDTDSDTVPDVASKGKQTAEADFRTTDPREDEPASSGVQNSDVGRGIYKRTEQAEAETRMQRGMTIAHSRAEPENEIVDIDATWNPGSFRRDDLRRNVTGPFDFDFFALSNTTASPNLAERANLINEIDANYDADDVIAGPTMNCNQRWDRLQADPEAQNGEFDLDGLCPELTAKAKSSVGSVVENRDFDSILRKYMGDMG